MPDVNFAANAYDKHRSGLRPEICENFLVERASPQSERRFRLVPRPGLVSFSSVASGMGRGLAFVDTVFSNKMLAVIGTSAYMVDSSGAATNIGTIAGSGPVDISVGRTEMVVINDLGEAYVITEAAALKITDPDLPPVSSSTYIGGRTIFTQLDTDTFYWSEILLSESVNALNFATAERKGDPARKVIADSDQLWFFGTKSTEIWQPTGNDNLPFIRLSSVDLQKGAAARDSVVAIDNTIYWAGYDRMVYRLNGYSAERISTIPIDDDLQALTEAQALTIKSFGMVVNGHTLYIMTCPGQWTYVYDASHGQWQKWKRFGFNDVQITGYTYAFGRHLVVDSVSSQIMELDTNAHDDLGQPVELRATANVPIRDRQACFNFSVDMVKGVGTASVPDPQIMMRYSDDQGRTWSSERWRSLGAMSDFQTRVTWRMLGQMRAPGREFEIKMTDAINGVIFGGRINDGVP